MRSTGSATIQFGLVNIPVQVCTATMKGEDDVRFDRVSSKTRAKFKQKYVDDDGHELGKGADALYGIITASGFVEVPKSSIDAIDAANKIKTLEIVDFVDAYQVASHLFRGFDYLQPQKGAEHAFSLFTAALKATNTVAITQWTPKSRVTPCIIRVTDNALVLQELYYATEIRQPDANVTAPVKAGVRPEELELAKALINAKMSPEFDHAAIVDTKAKARKELVAKVLEGKTVDAPVVVAQLPASMDLADLLKKSMS